MTWTAPMTFVDGHVLTAAQMNVHLRDNMMETEAAKATKSGGAYFVAEAQHRIVERELKTARISGTGTTTSTEYGNLSDAVGPEVECVTGTRAILFAGCRMENGTLNAQTRVAFEITGATNVTPVYSLLALDGVTAASAWRIGNFEYIDYLTPGTNKFTLKYAIGTGGGTTSTYSDRFIAVLPL